MEIFVLSFLIFVLSGIGLAFPVFLRGQKTAAGGEDQEGSQERGVCGRSCLCLLNSKGHPKPDGCAPKTKKKDPEGL